MNIRIEPNALYYGDCLEIIKNFHETGIKVDLICLDPPFNSNRRYNNIFKNSGLNITPQIKAFDDIWVWDEASAQRVEEVKNAVANPASKVIQAFELFIPESKMLSYTSYMAQRLFEMHRILKTTGTIYLHCDQTASHYLKLIVDAIFGSGNFRNEIIWHYDGPQRPSERNYGKKHDVILRYTKSDKFFADPEEIKPLRKLDKIELAEYKQTEDGRYYYDTPKGDYTDTSIKRLDEEGRIHWTKNGNPRVLHYLKEDEEGNIYRQKQRHDVWSDIPSLGQLGDIPEKLGYPTQKPFSLYERLIKASSKTGDLVLDPFCGCGTTIEAARKLNRNVIGIDLLPFALRLINQHRIVKNGLERLRMYGVPVDMETAVHLAETDPYKFQDWAISLIEGLAANPKKSGEGGIDGYGMFQHKPDNMDKKAIVVQVTGSPGSQLAKFERLQTTIRNNNAAMGILITRNAQTARKNWKHDLEPVQMGVTTYEPIQCFSIEEYYRDGERWDGCLNLPSLANPWTGKPMQTTLFEEVQTYAVV